MATIKTAEGHASVSAALTAMNTALASEPIDATTQCDIVKVGSGNWAYWIIYSQIQMKAKYCKYCGEKLTRHETDRCFKCFIKLDGGVCYPPKWWETHLPQRNLY